MEVITGGNLLQKIGNLGAFTESQACNVVKQLLLALNYMHSMQIMHRDLKPENILCEENADDENDNNIQIKLTDFGFATKYDPDQKQTLSLGSPFYMAPELCKEVEYDHTVDVWSVGIIAFVLLTGTPPFYDKSDNPNKAGIYNSIIEDDFDSDLLVDATPAALSFIEAALKKEPNKRPTIAELIEMPWIKEFKQASNLDSQLELDLSQNIESFAKASKFQSGICSILANLMTKTEDLGELREMFQKWDINNDGSLSHNEIKTNMAEITQLFSLDEPDILNLLKAADTNGDGIISYDEFLTAAFDKHKLLSEANLVKAFGILDIDGDGSISQQELMSVFGGGQNCSNESRE